MQAESLLQRRAQVVGVVCHRHLEVSQRGELAAAAVVLLVAFLRRRPRRVRRAPPVRQMENRRLDARNQTQTLRPRCRRQAVAAREAEQVDEVVAGRQHVFDKSHAHVPAGLLGEQKIGK
jgi:hypothetical protein